MPRINPRVITHRLSDDSSTRPIKQKKLTFAVDRNQAIAEEVDKLLKARFIREVTYLDWIANVVLVKKNNGKWRMCVDFTNLNKAFPKDSFPLPRIVALVDSTFRHTLLSFMDAFFGYNQIWMEKGDQEKTSFITDRGMYCYKIMLFRLKNVGASYQSMKAKKHINDLEETLCTLRRFQMKLNPTKCAFGVSTEKFLGFMVSHIGIEANPNKVEVILGMKPPQTTNEVQQLAGRVVALSQFISRSIDRCLP